MKPTLSAAPASVSKVGASSADAGRNWWCAVALLVAAFAAYANAFRVPFVFDDVTSIPRNETIRSLSTAWWPPKGQGSLTVAGRPLVNLTLGVNYAVSGLDVGSYHLFNLVIHALAGATLFGVMRRTLARPPMAARFGEHARLLAFVIAALWTLHPLQVEAVTYVVQRAESLMGLFFLLTLYGFVRSLDSPRPGWWQAFTVGACLLGVATKEVIVVAPLMVLLYDRAFVSGSFAAAWRRHRVLYLMLLVTWLPLIGFVASTGGDRSGNFHFTDVSMWVGHGLTQFEATDRYLGLAFWPHPLVFEYGQMSPPSLGAALPWALPVLALGLVTLVGLWRGTAAGFLGGWFFAILAPTALLPATLQIIVEHRMYLPLAAVIVWAVTGGYLLMGRRSLLVFLALALAAGCLTFRRNEDYVSEVSLWGDTVLKRPNSDHARLDYGLALVRADRPLEAAVQFQEAVRLRPDKLQAHNNLANVLAVTGRYAEAIAQYELVLRARPNERGVIENLQYARMLQQNAARAGAP